VSLHGSVQISAAGESMRESVRARASAVEGEAIELSHRIHAAPEVAFEEHRAASWLSELLERHGFCVQRGVANLPTALSGSIGRGDLVVGLFAEYDALPEIGHACGHNIISAAAALAAMALSPAVDDLGLTLKVFGAPAEERGGGKIVMLEHGVFEGLSAALMVHPTPHDLVRPTIAALAGLDIAFTGETPPAMSPEQGRNAGAAAVLMEVAVGLLRQNIRSTDRVAGIVREAGHSPNVLPARATMAYAIRSATDQRLAELVEQVAQCARGVAQATGTDVRIDESQPRYGALRHNERLGRIYQRNAEELGRRFVPVGEDDTERSAATDFGNVSARMAAIHPLIGVDAAGASNHQVGFTAACGGPQGDRAVRDAGVALALTVVDVAINPELRAELAGQVTSK
jgi:amidohydrolase